jgi:Icc-related predicted phosphoesterase
MKIACISDTHNMHEKLDKWFINNYKEIDVLVHSGDFTTNGTFKETYDFIKWLKEVPVQHKIFIAGNHDDCMFGQKPFSLDTNREDYVYYLNDSSVEIDGVRFYGSSWRHRIEEESYKPLKTWTVDIGEAAKNMKPIQSTQIDVLVTHMPPYISPDFKLDYNTGDYRAENHHGSQMLWSLVKKNKSIKAHIFGHIHEGNGQYEYLLEENLIKMKQQQKEFIKRFYH